MAENDNSLLFLMIQLVVWVATLLVSPGLTYVAGMEDPRGPHLSGMQCWQVAGYFMFSHPLVG